jgi:hypothetical protein
VAVNVYHTSSLLAPATAQVGIGKVVDWVALVVVPAATTPHNKSGFTVRAWALAHSSLAGGILAVTHILNLPVSPIKPHILIYNVVPAVAGKAMEGMELVGKGAVALSLQTTSVIVKAPGQVPVAVYTDNAPSVKAICGGVAPGPLKVLIDIVVAPTGTTILNHTSASTKPPQLGSAIPVVVELLASTLENV